MEVSGYLHRVVARRQISWANTPIRRRHRTSVRRDCWRAGRVVHRRSAGEHRQLALFGDPRIVRQLDEVTVPVGAVSPNTALNLALGPLAGW